MAVEHIISDVDTIQTIAVRYFNDVTKWKDIVDFNKLEYPYIVTDAEALDSLKASGYLTFTRIIASADIVIFQGSLIGTKVDTQGIQKTYAVTEDTTIPTGDTVGYVYVRCTTPGSFGNTVANSISDIIDLNTSIGQFIGDLTVINETSFNNGVSANVKMTGQSLYIPINENVSNTVTNVDNYVNQLGGEDLGLDDEGFLTYDVFGDIGSFVGLDNIMQAVKHRLVTESGSLVQHPEYGTKVVELIGSAQLPYIDKLIEFDIYEALAYEDRVTDVVINSITTDGTAGYIDLNLSINKQGTNMKLKLDI